MHRKPGSSVLTPPPMRVRPASTPNFAKPRIPPPPALPRFVLPNDTGELDLDAAKTSERRPLTMPAARRIVRKVRTPRPAPVLAPDQTDEVALQDILLEAYLEDPPPPSANAGVAPVAIPYEPPRPSQGRAVDALLRTSDPGIPAIAHGGLHPMSSSFPATSYELPPPSSAYVPAMPADFESPSVAPVAYGSIPSYPTACAPSQPPVHVPPARKGTNVGAIFALVILIFAVSAGTGAFLAMPTGTVAHWTTKAKEAVGKKSAPAVAAPPAAAATSASASAPASAPASAFASPSALPSPSTSAPTVAVDSLAPKGGIHPKTTLVVFPPSARGHRIWVDGTMVTAGDKPTMLKCGHRKIQIGSAGKLRKVELPCGKQIVLDE